MPTKKLTTRRTKRTKRNYPQHVTFRQIEDPPKQIEDFCSNGCLKKTTQVLINSRRVCTRRGSTWGQLKSVQYTCVECFHVYTSRAWRPIPQQLTFLDMAKVSDK